MKSITARLVAWFAAVTLLLTGAVAGAPAVGATPSSAPSKVPAVLKVGTEGVYPPFSFKEKGRLIGFDVDVMRAVGKRLGVKIKFVEVQWDSMFEALKSGRIDVVANQVTASPERKALYDLSTPYVESTGVVVVGEDNTSIKGVKDLKGKRAAENLTSNWKDVAKKNGAEIVGVDSVDKAIQNLRSGRVDTIVNDKLAIRYAIKSLGGEDKAGVKVVSETSDKSQAVLAARKGSGYLPQLNSAIKSLKSDGTLKKAYDKYFGADPKPKSDWELVKDNLWPMTLALFKVSLTLMVVSFALGLLIGLGVALARMSTNGVLATAARFYISIFRGLPVLVLLLLVFFGPSQFSVTMPSYLSGVIALTLNASAYCAETIRATLQSIPKGQWEAAQTVGMDYRTSLRRIVIPQAARTAIPPLSNTMIELLKSTALVSVILLVDPLRQAQIAAAPTFRFFTMFVLAGLYYWLAVVVLTAVQNRVEARVSRYAS